MSEMLDAIEVKLTGSKRPVKKSPMHLEADMDIMAHSYADEYCIKTMFTARFFNQANIEEGIIKREATKRFRAALSDFAFGEFKSKLYNLSMICMEKDVPEAAEIVDQILYDME